MESRWPVPLERLASNLKTWHPCAGGNAAQFRRVPVLGISTETSLAANSATDAITAPILGVHCCNQEISSGSWLERLRFKPRSRQPSGTTYLPTGCRSHSFRTFSPPAEAWCGGRRAMRPASRCTCRPTCAMHSVGARAQMPPSAISTRRGHPVSRCLATPSFALRSIRQGAGALKCPWPIPLVNARQALFPEQVRSAARSGNRGDRFPRRSSSRPSRPTDRSELRGARRGSPHRRT